ncbi:MAG TPA: hypothetical protein VMH05_05405 [Bryobacteraceae bacterium]|nr:hypothetical protein [Bryobacteraceae bacterium]
MRLSALLLLLAAFASAEPRLLYTKYFKGSVPEYVAITVERSGATTYQEAKEDDSPIKIQLSDRDTQTLFDLAQKLDHFQRPLESGLKVANMGTKTFGFEDGAAKHSIEFNYSLDADAQALLDWFERITETEGHLVNLDRTVHFDKLGVNDVLLQLQITWDHKRLVAPEQFLPLLDRIVKNESFLHIARERAAGLAEDIRRTTQVSDKTQPEKAQP